MVRFKSRCRLSRGWKVAGSLRPIVELTFPEYDRRTAPTFLQNLNRYTTITHIGWIIHEFSTKFHKIIVGKLFYRNFAEIFWLKSDGNSLQYDHQFQNLSTKFLRNIKVITELRGNLSVQDALPFGDIFMSQLPKLVNLQRLNCLPRLYQDDTTKHIFMQDLDVQMIANLLRKAPQMCIVMENHFYRMEVSRSCGAVQLYMKLNFPGIEELRRKIDIAIKEKEGRNSEELDKEVTVFSAISHEILTRVRTNRRVIVQTAKAMKNIRSKMSTTSKCTVWSK